MSKFREIDLAYAAGIVDGEGCIFISSSMKIGGVRPSHRLLLVVANNDKRVCGWFKEMFGGNIYTSGRKGEHYSYHWKHEGINAATLLWLFRPYLIIKKEQANVAMRFQAFLEKTLGARSDEVIAERERFKQRLHGLKKANFDKVVPARFQNTSSPNESIR